MDRERRYGAQLSAFDLQAISGKTLQYYDENASSFCTGTADHDVDQNIDALLAAISGLPPFRILDFGCGPGRDLNKFKSLGHEPVGLDGSAAFVSMAQRSSGCEVLRQDFLALDLPASYFDGVFANASLFHVPQQELARVLATLWQTLKPDGVFFASNPRGNNQEGWSANRYGCFHDLDQWRGYVVEAGFKELRHYYRPPGRSRDQQPWLATVWRKPDAD
ncbi:class I SAM-dependent methyltransferase [Pseudomonadota bacterium]